MPRGRSAKRARSAGFAGRSRRREADQSPEQNDRRWDRHAPENWTASELRNRLAARNIRVPQGTTKAFMLKLFKANPTDNATLPLDTDSATQNLRTPRRGRSASATLTLADVNGDTEAAELIDASRNPQPSGHVRGDMRPTSPRLTEPYRTNSVDHREGQLESLTSQVSQLQSVVRDLTGHVAELATRQHGNAPLVAHCGESRAGEIITSNMADTNNMADVNIQHASSSMAPTSARLHTLHNVIPDMQQGLRGVRNTGAYGVAADALSDIDIVSQATRQRITEGKDVNLALLLLSNNLGMDVTNNETRVVDSITGEVRLKPDARLCRPLTIGEFVAAFGRYKNIMCEAWPLRRPELDMYERDVIDMSQRYGGFTFYEYHKAFSAKAAAYLEQRGIKLDWSIRDNKLYNTLFSGMKAQSCHLCSSQIHVTTQCPLAANMTPANLRNSSRPQYGASNSGFDIHGRKRVVHQGKEVCNNYNKNQCFRPQCNRSHVCSLCFRGHPRVQHTDGEKAPNSKIKDK